MWEVIGITLHHLIEFSEEMVSNMSKKYEISPSLREIVNHFNVDKRPPDTFSSGMKQAEQVDEVYNSGTEFSADTFENRGTWDVDHDEQKYVADEGTYGGDTILSSHYEVLNFLSSIYLLLTSIIFYKFSNGKMKLF